MPQKHQTGDPKEASHAELGRPAKVGSASEALRELRRVKYVFGKDDALPDTRDDPIALKELRRARQQKARDLLREHRLETHRERYDAAMLEAAQTYWNWWRKNYRKTIGVGWREDAEALRTQLGKVIKHLCDPKICNRLELAAAKMAEAGERPNPLSSNMWVGGLPVFESVLHARGTVMGLANVLAWACTLDGREAGRQHRADLRIAAEPLLRFWTGDAGRRVNFYARGGDASPTARFLGDSLSMIDAGVTPRIMVELFRRPEPIPPRITVEHLD
jgi:hypothetical protein